MRNKPTNNLLLHDFFFYVGYSVWIVVTAFLITVPALSQITTVLKFFSILCWILAIVFYKWYFKQLLLYTLFIFFSLIIFYFSRVIIVIILPIVLMASSEIDIKKIAKVDLFVRSICVFLTFISYCLGMSPGNDIPSTWSVLDIRYSLGYYHPNNLFAQIFVICAAILVCYSKRIGVLHYFILFFFVVLFGVITQSRTGMLVLCLTIVLVSLRRKIKFSRLFTYCIHYSFIIFLFISFVSSVFYEKSNIIFRFINQLLSGRIEFASRQLNNYGISLLGQKINYTSTLDSKYSSVQPLIVDNYYVYCLISFGLLYTLVLTYLFTKTQNKLLKNHEFLLSVILFSYTVYSLTEKPFSDLNNFVLVLLNISFFVRGRIDNE